MFNTGFPSEGSTIKKLSWLYRTVINVASAVLKTVTGNPIHILDALAKPAEALSVAITPAQDLHGYSSPWPPGGGKNLSTASAEGSGTDVGVKFVYSGNTITASGTATGGNAEKTIPIGPVVLKANTQYVLGFGHLGVIKNIRILGTAYMPASDGHFTLQFTEDTTVSSFVLRLSSSSGVAINDSWDWQLEEGSTPTAYTPYSNICPISGHTGADVYRTGVNVWDEEWEVGDINASGQNASANDRIRSKNYISVKPNTTYYIKAPYGVWFWGYDAEKNYVQRVPNSNSLNNATLTVPSGIYYLRFVVRSNYGTTYNNDISINYPSTDHDYHAYVGTTYPIPLGTTVYGGTLDVVTGVLTVDRAMDTLNGTQTLYPNGLTSARAEFYFVPSSTKKPAAQFATQNEGIVSDIFKSQPFADVPYVVTGRTANGNIYFSLPPEVNSATLANAWLSSNNANIVYELAMPQTYQLTPTQMQLLLGENNVWSDAGDTTLTYYADGNASDEEALNILLGGRYVNNHGEDEPTDREALDILLGR